MMNLSTKDIERLAVEVVALAAKDALKGSKKAKAWLKSPSAQIWFEAAGFEPDALLGKITLLIEQPECIKNRLRQIRARRNDSQPHRKAPERFYRIKGNN